MLGRSGRGAGADQSGSCPGLMVEVYGDEYVVWEPA